MRISRQIEQGAANTQPRGGFSSPYIEDHWERGCAGLLADIRSDWGKHAAHVIPSLLLAGKQDIWGCDVASSCRSAGALFFSVTC